MTQIDVVNIETPVSYRFSDQDITMRGTQASDQLLEELQELFAYAREGSAIRVVPGQKPVGFDQTEDSLNTRYITFTHGSKPKNGWYLLLAFNTFQDDSPVGFSPTFDATFFFLGSEAYLTEAYKVKSLTELTNDWGI